MNCTIMNCVQGQFNVCIVVVEPYEHGLNRVLIKSKDDMLLGKFLAHVDTQVVSDCNVALLARQLALHAAVSINTFIHSEEIHSFPLLQNGEEPSR
jgi:hypothetical protein